MCDLLFPQGEEGDQGASGDVGAQGPTVRHQAISTLFDFVQIRVCIRLGNHFE